MSANDDDLPNGILEGKAPVKEWIVENSWTCSFCKAKNRGRDLICQQCKAAKDSKIKDEIPVPETAEQVTDALLLAKAQDAANWVCEFCGSQDRNADGTCHNCGAGKSKLTLADPVPAPAPKPRRRWWLRLGVVAAIMLILYMIFRPKAHDVRVGATSWKLTKELEKKTLSRGSGWGSPGGAFNVSCQRREHGTENCHAHECSCHNVCKDNKNGFSTCNQVCSTCYDQCPAYADWCEYEYYAWPTVDTKVTSGAGREVTWPFLEAPGGDYRVTQREDYEVRFEQGGDGYTYHPQNLNDYQRFEVGAAWRIKVSVGGGVTPEAPQ